MTRFTVNFDDDESVWRFRNDEPRNGAPIRATFHGLAWTAATSDPAEPMEVEVTAEPSPIVVAAIRHLLGDEAAAMITGPPPPARPDGTRLAGGRVEAPDDRLAERTAMGMLALASVAPQDRPLRALDTAVLLLRAGLDRVLTSPALGGAQVGLPDGTDLADDAMEVLDMLPVALRTALEGEAPSIASAWALARGAVADARRFTVAVGGDPLDGVDVDAEFAALASRLGDLLGQAEPGDEPGQRVDAEVRQGIPAFRGRPHGEQPLRPPVTAVLADPMIRGVVGIGVRWDGDKLEIRSPIRPGASRLEARVLGVGAPPEVLAAGPMVRTDESPTELLAVFRIDPGLELSRVEVVQDLQQPVGPLGVAMAAHRSAMAGEAERVLAQLVLARESTDERRRSTIETMVAALGATPEGDQSDGGMPASILSRPSDALQVMLAEVGDEVLAELRAVASPADRAARANDVGLLLEGCVLPWGQSLLGEVSMIEAESRSDQLPHAAVNAAERAVNAYAAAGDDNGFVTARTWISKRGGGVVQ